MQLLRKAFDALPISLQGCAHARGRRPDMHANLCSRLAVLWVHSSRHSKDHPVCLHLLATTLSQISGSMGKQRSISLPRAFSLQRMSARWSNVNSTILVVLSMALPSLISLLDDIWQLWAMPLSELCLVSHLNAWICSRSGPFGMLRHSWELLEICHPPVLLFWKTNQMAITIMHMFFSPFFRFIDTHTHVCLKVHKHSNTHIIMQHAHVCAIQCVGSAGRTNYSTAS